MGSDPYTPDYQPDANGTRPNLGDVGHGNQFGLDLYDLYRAGRVHFPDMAARFSALASDLPHAGGSISTVQSAAGGPAALGKILDLREQVHAAIYKMTTSLTALGPVLVKVADDFAATDEEARSAFSDRLGDKVEHQQYTSPPVQVPPPPRPDEPPAPAPGHMSRPGGPFFSAT